jgi:hydrogenase expression/formation protein HypC
MCLSIPAKIISIDNDKAIASVGGTEYEASLQLLDDVVVGDYVLLHTGFAIQKLSEDEAIETIQMFKELDELNKKKE